MRTNFTFLFCIIVMLPFSISFLSCNNDKDNNDSATTVNYSLLSAVWEFQEGYYEKYSSNVSEFRWLDDECEDAFDGYGNPLMEEFDEERTLSKAFHFSDTVAIYNQTLTTTEHDLFDTLYSLPVAQNEFEDAYSKNGVAINYDYELTIKKNGDYRVYITYNYYDADVPTGFDQNGNLQFGLTYSGTNEYIDRWYCTENDNGKIVSIRLAGVPMPFLNIVPMYDLSNYPDLEFDYNYVSEIGFENLDLVFDVEMITNKEMVLVIVQNENDFYQQQSQENEAYLLDGTPLDCLGTLTETNVDLRNIYLRFTSDGADVPE